MHDHMKRDIINNNTLISRIHPYPSIFQYLASTIMRTVVLLMSIILPSMITLFVPLVLEDIGTATSYGPPYIPTKCNGARQEQFPPGNLFVAVSEGLWDNGAACGRRYRLRCLSGNNKPCKGGSIDVKVVDFCRQSPCPSTILMSNDAFAAVSRSPTARINVEYIQI